MYFVVYVKAGKTEKFLPLFLRSKKNHFKEAAIIS